MHTSAMKRCLRISVATILGAVLIASPAAAQSMKPGLWEVTNKVGGSGDAGAKMAAAQAQMQHQFAAMPPEQRKMMEDMMAKRGVNMGPGAPVGGMAVRICITKDMAARNEPPAQEGKCTRDSIQRSGNTTRFKFTCTNPPSSGEGAVTLHNPESYTMKMNMSSQVGGKPEQMTMDAQGKWVGSDCGNIKPLKG